MKENLKDILLNLNPDVDQETLMLYLQGKLSPEQQHELEKQMLDNDFEADAMEGLDNLNDKKKLSLIVDQLNRDLKKKAFKRKTRRDKMQLKSDPWLWITVIIILILIVISFVVIHRLQQP